jgi:hypothetical protein
VTNLTPESPDVEPSQAVQGGAAEEGESLVALEASNADARLAQDAVDQGLATSYERQVRDLALHADLGVSRQVETAAQRLAEQLVSQVLSEPYRRAVRNYATRADLGISSALQEAGARLAEQLAEHNLSDSYRRAMQDLAMKADLGVSSQVERAAKQLAEQLASERLADPYRRALRGLEMSGGPGGSSSLSQALRGLALEPSPADSTTKIVSWLLQQGIPADEIVETARTELSDDSDEQAGFEGLGAPTSDGEAPPAVPARGQFSPEFIAPGAFFAHHEVLVNSFDDLMGELLALSRKFPDNELVWRGQQNADWGLHSSLYRRICATWGVQLPGKRSPGEIETQQLPDEDALARAERALFSGVAPDWRMASQSGLELLARLQHHGGPTRLLDVTRNPLIATWFAVEAGDEERSDARLFAIPAAPTDPAAHVLAVFSELRDAVRPAPSWLDWGRSERLGFSWGSGTLRRIWVPPAYDPRIPAQNAAFLVEGVPSLTRDSIRQFRKPDGGQWRAVDIVAATSVLARPRHPHRAIRRTKLHLSSIFSFRISATAKEQIRRTLERTFGYKASLLYPDAEGLSRHLHADTSWLQAGNRA